ncbi:hypothetical protein [Shouchella patagoniensis]|uniref:hypothetical protein n=1 Tax=Shouchella patagoniensis TaxID=228576 RepID=UPI00099550B3|nr:hypothetical protein [Shouchella patagoniensis]
MVFEISMLIVLVTFIVSAIILTKRGNSFKNFSKEKIELLNTVREKEYKKEKQLDQELRFLQKECTSQQSTIETKLKEMKEEINALEDKKRGI